MHDEYFEILTESAGSGRYRATEATAGPWSPQHQHGGPPNALVVAAAERLAAVETGRGDLVAMRLATEFVGPVPVGELETQARIRRAARGAVLVEVVLAAGGRDCLHSRVWLVRDADTAELATPAGPVPDIPEQAGLDAEFGYAASLDWRLVRGGLRDIGPGAVWVRAATQLTPGHVPTGLQLAALVGDSASGISASLDWSVWSFLNVDLDVHLARPIAGEWLYLDAATQLGGRGSALARSTLSDRCGPVGGTMQTLVLSARR